MQQSTLKKCLLVFKDYKIISGIKEIPSQHLLAQSYHKKQQNKKQNMFKVNKRHQNYINYVFMVIDIVFMSLLTYDIFHIVY